MSYKFLNCSVTLEHLEEGQVIDIEEYIEKLKFFAKYSRFGIDKIFKTEGTYITEKCYIEYTETGLHYYKFGTLIKFFEKFRTVNRFGRNKKQLVKITFDKNHILECEKVEDAGNEKSLKLYC